MSINVLFISSAIPPHFESQTIRNAYFIKALKSVGQANVRVIATPATKIDRTLDTILDSKEFETLYIGPPWFQRFSVFCSEKLPVIFVKVLMYVANLVLAPDLQSGWSKMVLKSKQAERLAKWSDVIISSSGSYEAHLAANALSLKYRKRHVAELGDPWAKNPIWPETFFLKKMVNSHLEKRVLKSADLVTFTTHETSSLYKEDYPGVHIETIPMGFSKDDFVDRLNSSLSAEDELKLLYIGVAYKGSRDIRPLFDALNGIERVDKSLEIYGYTSPSFRQYAENNGMDFVRINGAVEYSKSVELLNQPSVLVILGNDGALQIPGKVYMCLASQNPILYLAREKDSIDPTWKLLSQFGGVVRADARNAEDIVGALNKLRANLKDLRIQSSKRCGSKALLNFEWEQTSGNFAKLVQEFGER